jgi:hypothetical protein
MSAVGDALELAGWTGLAASRHVSFLADGNLRARQAARFGASIHLDPLAVRCGSDLLGLQPGGGAVLGNRAMKLVGVEVGVATAMMAQIAFHRPRPRHPALSPADRLCLGPCLASPHHPVCRGAVLRACATGGALGIAAEFARALSLLKRGRELVLGTAALLLWHSIESRRMWRTLRPLAASAAALSPEASPDNQSPPSGRLHL